MELIPRFLVLLEAVDAVGGGNTEFPARLQDPGGLFQEGGRVAEMLYYLETDRFVEGRVGERQTLPAVDPEFQVRAAVSGRSVGHGVSACVYGGYLAGLTSEDSAAVAFS